MPRKPKAASVDPIPLTCGACRFCSDNGGKTSPSCYAHPPVQIVDPDGDLISMRPIVRLTDMACALHQPRLNS